MSAIIFGLLSPIFAVLWFVFCFLGNSLSVILGSLFALCACGCAAIAVHSTRAGWKNRSFDGNYSAVVHLSEREFFRVLLCDALKAHTQGKYNPIARKTIILRTVGTVVFLTTGFILLECLYYSPWLVAAMGLLFGAFTLLWLLTDTISVLVFTAKHNPNLDFDKLVQKETCNAGALCKGLFCGGIGLTLAATGLFCARHLRAKWQFETQGQECTMVSYRPALFGTGDLEIPAEYNGIPVTVIGERAFANVPMDSLTIPDSVHTIEKQAFAGCKQLAQVTLSNQLTKVSSGAFKNCKKLSAITLPETLCVLEGEAFMHCEALERIVLPESVTEIRGSTFEGCIRLKYVTWHDTITAIHAKAFRDCSALANIALPPKITEIREATFENCSSLTFVSIPIGVTRIAAHSFMGCSKLSEVYVPDTVTQIRSSAFRNCPSLKTIELPDGITVDERAFKESPTEIIKKTIPDAFWTQAIAESRDKDTTVFYCVYETAKGADSIMYWNDPDTVLVADDEKISQLCSEDWSVLVCNGYSELKAYLQKAEAAGIRQVLYGRYSQMASEKLDTCYFFSNTWMLDDTIALCDEKIAESENG